MLAIELWFAGRVGLCAGAAVCPPTSHTCHVQLSPATAKLISWENREELIALPFTCILTHHLFDAPQLARVVHRRAVTHGKLPAWQISWAQTQAHHYKTNPTPVATEGGLKTSTLPSDHSSRPFSASRLISIAPPLSSPPTHTQHTCADYCCACCCCHCACCCCCPDLCCCISCGRCCSAGGSPPPAAAAGPPCCCAAACCFWWYCCSASVSLGTCCCIRLNICRVSIWSSSSAAQEQQESDDDSSSGSSNEG